MLLVLAIITNKTRIEIILLLETILELISFEVSSNYSKDRNQSSFKKIFKNNEWLASSFLI